MNKNKNNADDATTRHVPTGPTGAWCRGHGRVDELDAVGVHRAAPQPALLPTPELLAIRWPRARDDVQQGHPQLLKNGSLANGSASDAKNGSLAKASAGGPPGGLPKPPPGAPPKPPPKLPPGAPPKPPPKPPPEAPPKPPPGAPPKPPPGAPGAPPKPPPGRRGRRRSRPGHRHPSSPPCRPSWR